MFDHLGITVQNLKSAEAFYAKALAPLNIKKLFEVTEEMTGGNDAFVGFGVERPMFWLGTGAKAPGGMHIAFAAKSRADVDAFYKEAIAAGGKDNGAPGLRPQYHADYYGAFVIDFDGNNVEAVCHIPE